MIIVLSAEQLGAVVSAAFSFLPGLGHNAHAMYEFIAKQLHAFHYALDCDSLYTPNIIANVEKQLH